MNTSTKEYKNKNKKLAIKCKNKFGDLTYVEIDIHHKKKNYVELFDLPDDIGYWSILSPSNTIKEHYPNCKTRIYGDKEYLLSTKASEVISINPNTYGSCAVLCFLHGGQRYFIMTIDYKNYVQNPQGGANEGEDNLTCVIREIEEELKVIVNKDQCVCTGHWSFLSKNNLVNTIFNVRTELYYIEVSYEQIQHLILSDKIVNDKLPDFQIINVCEYDFVLDETQYVIISSFDDILNHDEFVPLDKNGKFINHSWNGHHRQAILSIFGMGDKYEVNYLKEFEVNYLKEFDVKNLFN